MKFSMVTLACRSILLLASYDMLLILTQNCFVLVGDATIFKISIIYQLFINFKTKLKMDIGRMVVLSELDIKTKNFQGILGEDTALIPSYKMR